MRIGSLKTNYVVRISKHFALYAKPNHALANTNADQKARLLESKVATNIETIEQLRKERSMLVADHKKLQHQFAQVSEVCRFVSVMCVCC